MKDEECAQRPKELRLSNWSLSPATNWRRHLHKTTSNVQQKKESS